MQTTEWFTVKMFKQRHKKRVSKIQTTCLMFEPIQGWPEPKCWSKEYIKLQESAGKNCSQKRFLEKETFLKRVFGQEITNYHKWQSIYFLDQKWLQFLLPIYKKDGSDGTRFIESFFFRFGNIGHWSESCVDFKLKPCGLGTAIILCRKGCWKARAQKFLDKRFCAKGPLVRLVA